MKKILLFSILFGITFFVSDKNIAFADPGLAQAARYQSVMQSTGYTCTTTNDTGNVLTITCTKAGYTYGAVGVAGDPYSLEGTREPYPTEVTPFSYNSPFIYFSNPPQGNIFLSINSKLNSYLPIPFFNAYNGWNLTGDKQKGTVSIEGKEQKKLFYELAMDGVTLSRNGQNFNSKENLTSFLNNSDFFDKLGFSQEQKENSLKYVLEKLNYTRDSKYYYLTILNKSSIADISELKIQPKPNKITRNYIAIYPSDVPVKTTGDFVFPRIEKENGFNVKETGELLIPNGMTVFFK